ncbi:hypothetical protein PENTCL1PPCAC_1394, partial [Pristionchus entomophagus]
PMQLSLAVASAILLVAATSAQQHAQGTIRLQSEGDQRSSGSHAHHHAPPPPHDVAELPYCIADPNEHLHWTIVGGVITALLVSLIYVHQQYAAVQYQHALLVRIYRSRAKRDDEDLEAIRKELRGKRSSPRLSEYLDRKKKETASDDAKTARDLASKMTKKGCSIRRLRTAQEKREDDYANPANNDVLIDYKKSQEEPKSDPPPNLEPTSG